jgi:hypothetical protein
MRFPLTLIGFILLAAPFGASSATLTVTNTLDSGAGSLRGVVQLAASGDTIAFAVSGTINVLTGIDISKNLTIAGPGAATLAVTGNAKTTYIFRIVTGSTVAISGLTLSNAYNAIDNPGNLTVSNAVIRDNIGSIGAGITGCYSSNSLTVSDTSFINNAVMNGGGAIAACRTLNITRSTFVGNTAGDSNNTGYGAAIDIGNSGTATISNSTFFNNSSAGDGGSGGAIRTDYNGLTITNSTFASNSAALGSSLYIGQGVTVNVRNSIFTAGIGGSNCNIAITGENTNNLDHGGVAPLNSCGASVTGDPILGPLAANGGVTQTMALLTGSAAINAGSNTAAASLSSDQRGTGFPRIFSSVVDIGAYESQALVVIPPVLPVLPVPALSAWGLLAIASILVVIGMFLHRRAR